jgi:hypothetical protein
MEHYVAQIEKMIAIDDVFASKVKAKEPNGVEKLISDGLNWKVAGADVKQIARVYTILTLSPTEAERLANWEKPIHIQIFTDDNGKILAWWNADRTKGWYKP